MKVFYYGSYMQWDNLLPRDFFFFDLSKYLNVLSLIKYYGCSNKQLNWLSSIRMLNVSKHCNGDNVLLQNTVVLICDSSARTRLVTSADVISFPMSTV